MSTRVTFTGGKELHRALLAMSTKETKRVGRAALRKAAKPILDAARANVPVDQGRLKRALRLRVDTLRNNRSVMSAMIDVRKTAPRIGRASSTMPKVYGQFVEYGTNDTRPQPFMRPAWDSLGSETALDRIGRELGEGLERAAAGMARGR